MTPIEKNVIVLDEQEKILGVTYPRRAKGLIKKGRAHFVDNNKICLVRPPDRFMEINIMEKIKQYTDEEQHAFIQNANIKPRINQKYITVFVDHCDLSRKKTDVEILVEVDGEQRHYKNLAPTDESEKAFVCEVCVDGSHHCIIRQFADNDVILFEHNLYIGPCFTGPMPGDNGTVTAC